MGHPHPERFAWWTPWDHFVQKKPNWEANWGIGEVVKSWWKTVGRKVRRAEGPACTMADAVEAFSLPMSPSLPAPPGAPGNHGEHLARGSWVQPAVPQPAAVILISHSMAACPAACPARYFSVESPVQLGRR